jgi:hypothetical protein
MVSVRPQFANVPTNALPRHKDISGKLSAIAGGVGVVFLAIVVARYLFPDESLQYSRPWSLFRILPTGGGTHHEALRWIALAVGMPLLLWFLGVFDRR